MTMMKKLWPDDVDQPMNMPLQVAVIAALLDVLFPLSIGAVTLLSGTFSLRATLWMAAWLGCLSVPAVLLCILKLRWDFGTFRPTRRMVVEEKRRRKHG